MTSHAIPFPGKKNAGRRVHLPPRLALEVPVMEESLADFVRSAWRWAGEPLAFEDNWHIDMMADYLMAVARREIKGPGPLIFSMPPRHMKSRILNVFFCPWCWAQDPDPKGEGHGVFTQPGTFLGPGTKFANISYKQALSDEHSDFCRMLIKSDWYQARWGHRFKLSRDATMHFNNNLGGDRRAMSFTGVTGFGADIVVIDDAHDIEKSESELTREHVLYVWDYVLQTRLNDPRTGIFIVMMQRSHERDLIGHILAKEFNGMHVCLPAEYEAKHPYVFKRAKRGWEVPRKTDSAHGKGKGPKIGEEWYDFRKEGQLLWPKRITLKALRHQQSQMTAHAAAGQFQQRPTALEGSLFKRVWFDNPVKSFPETAQLVRAWDLAGTAAGLGQSDFTVGVKMAIEPDTNNIYVVDVIRGRWSPAEVEAKIVSTARWDGEECIIRIPQDPGSAGKFQASYLVSRLLGYTTRTEVEGTSKEARADPFAAQCEHGFVKLVEGEWNECFVDELCAFPNGMFDDQVDAASAAFRALARRVVWSVA